MARRKPKTLEIGGMTYWSSGHDLGECDDPHCNQPAFSYNEDGEKYCEDCLENWHEEQELKELTGDDDDDDD